MECYLFPAKREAKDRSFTQMKGSVLRKIKNERVKEMYTYTSGLRQGSMCPLMKQNYRAWKSNHPDLLS